MAASAAPPRTVKSSALSTTVCESMRPRPTSKFEGVKLSSEPSAW